MKPNCRPALPLSLALLTALLLTGCPATAPGLADTSALPTAGAGGAPMTTGVSGSTPTTPNGTPATGPGTTPAGPGDTTNASVGYILLDGIASIANVRLANATVSVEDAITGQPLTVLDDKTPAPAGTMAVYRSTLVTDSQGNFSVVLGNPLPGSVLRIVTTQGSRTVTSLLTLNASATPAQRKILAAGCVDAPVSAVVRLNVDISTVTTTSFKASYAQDIAAALNISASRIKIVSAVAGYNLLQQSGSQSDCVNRIPVSEVSTALTDVALQVAKLAASGLPADKVGAIITNMLTKLSPITQQIQATFNANPNLAKTVTDSAANAANATLSTNVGDALTNAFASVKSTVDTAVSNAVTTAFQQSAGTSKSIAVGLNGLSFIGTNLKIDIAADGKTLTLTDTFTGKTITADVGGNTTTTSSSTSGDAGGGQGSGSFVSTFSPTIQTLNYKNGLLTMVVSQPSGGKQVDVKTIVARIRDGSGTVLNTTGVPSAFNPGAFPDPIATNGNGNFSQVVVNALSATLPLQVNSGAVAPGDMTVTTPVSNSLDPLGGTLSNPDYAAYLVVDPGTLNLKIARFQVYKARAFDSGTWDVLALAYNPTDNSTSHLGNTTTLVTSAFTSIAAGATVDVVFTSRASQIQSARGTAVTFN